MAGESMNRLRELLALSHVLGGTAVPQASSIADESATTCAIADPIFEELRLDAHIPGIV
jgi:hypothetical protein